MYCRAAASYYAMSPLWVTVLGKADAGAIRRHMSATRKPPPKRQPIDR